MQTKPKPQKFEGWLIWLELEQRYYSAGASQAPTVFLTMPTETRNRKPVKCSAVVKVEQ